MSVEVLGIAEISSVLMGTEEQIKDIPEQLRCKKIHIVTLDDQPEEPQQYFAYEVFKSSVLCSIDLIEYSLAKTSPYAIYKTVTQYRSAEEQQEYQIHGHQDQD